MQPRLEEIMLRVSQSPLIDAGNQDAAIRLVLDSVCAGLAIQRAGVWFFDTGANGIRCALLIDLNSNTESENTLLTEQDFPNYFVALMQERAVVAHDAQHDTATAEFRDSYLQPLGISSMMDVPIRHHGKMIGIICAEHTGKQRHWSDDEITFASSLGDLVGRAINASANRQAQDALAALNTDLESRIEERTRALAASNDELRQTLDQLTRARDELVRSEKLAALGALVAGVAHELNTPLGNSLTVGSTWADDLAAFREELANGQVRRASLEHFVERSDEASALIVRNITRAAQLVTNFKQIAVDQTSDRRRSFQLHELVQEIVQTLCAGWRGTIQEIVTDIPEGIVLDSFPGGLGQLLQNLLQNARIHGFDEQLAGEIRLHAECPTPEHVRLVISDNGRGIPPEVLPRIFDPFFTTRMGQGGSGLGLHIVHNLATHLLGGQLQASSTLGQGSRFVLELPLQAPHGVASTLA